MSSSHTYILADLGQDLGKSGNEGANMAKEHLTLVRGIPYGRYMGELGT